MGSLSLYCVALVFLICPCSALWTGTEFALSFMQNFRYTNPSLQLHITAVQAYTKVTVEVPFLNYKRVVNLHSGNGITITLPSKVLLFGVEKTSKTVRITASAHISVSSSNDKSSTSDTSIIFPTSEWGTEYFIYTPRISPTRHTFKEFAVTNGKETNTVSFTIKGMVKFAGRVYRSGSRLQIALQPYESVQLQSLNDLSGSQITSTKPVAVFSGHSCTWRFSYCSHVYEQLLPVSKWGKSFLLPPLIFQKKFDSVYVQASQNTKVTFQNKKRKYSFSLSKGRTKEIRYTYPTALSFEADRPIQVFLLFNGGNGHDPFLINMVSTDRFCSAYRLMGLNYFDNQALIVAKTNEISKVKLNGGALQNVQWRTIEGTDYSWVKISYKLTQDGHTVSSSGSPFGLYSIGVKSINGYGSAGQCITPALIEEPHKRCWTKWFDRDDPSGTGDWEVLSLLRKENPEKICENPMSIEALTLSGLTPGAAGDVVKLDKDVGLICKNVEQKNKKCNDYKVRFSCHEPYCAEEVCWTGWFDRDNPSGTGDWETMSDLRKQYPGKICKKPKYIEAVTVSGNIPATATGQDFIIYSPTQGFVCKNKPGQYCEDYKVRFGCCCD